MVGKLPLNSPLWVRLSACYSSENAIARLREIVATRQLGEAWRGLCDEILQQGSVYGVSSAAIPHLVDVAPYLPAVSRRDLWIEIGFPVTAGAAAFAPRPCQACRRASPPRCVPRKYWRCGTFLPMLN